MLRVEVEGLKEFRSAIKLVDKSWGKELRLVNLEAAQRIARVAASAYQRPSARPGIKGTATQKAGFVRIGAGRGDALAVVLGQKQRSGWYGWRRYRPSNPRQFRPWVGNQWDPGDTAGVPYDIGPAVNAAVPQIVDMYGDAIEKLAARAFPT